MWREMDHASFQVGRCRCRTHFFFGLHSATYANLRGCARTLQSDQFLDPYPRAMLRLEKAQKNGTPLSEVEYCRFRTRFFHALDSTPPSVLRLEGVRTDTPK